MKYPFKFTFYAYDTSYAGAIKVTESLGNERKVSNKFLSSFVFLTAYVRPIIQ